VVSPLPTVIETSAEKSLQPGFSRNIAFPNLMRYTKILTPDSSKPKTLYLTTMEIAILGKEITATTVRKNSFFEGSRKKIIFG
jgi:hypothetical protein